MSAIFIHLSDIHFGQEKDGGKLATNTDAKNCLIKDVRSELETKGVTASGIIVTGDIAYSAQEEEYAAAGAWLDQLAKCAGCDPKSIQLVPGNHDIDREAINEALSWKLKLIREKGDPFLDALLDDDKDRESLFTRFEAYRNFAEAYGCDLDTRGEYSADYYVELAPGRKLRFVRLNSALICAKKDIKGGLILGARQRILPEEDGEEVVVLMHHPLTWFLDTVEAGKYIENRARVVISGHEHYPSVEVKPVEGGSDLMMLAAGATAPDEVDGKYTYKYNILEFDWDRETDSLAVSINPRTWDDCRKKFSRDDEFLAGTEGAHILASPNFRRSAPPALDDYQKSTDAPAVNAIVNPITGSGKAEMDIDVRDRTLRLKFFRDINDAQRLKILVDLADLPDDIHKLDHSLERTFFARILKKGLGNELAAAIEIALTNPEEHQ
ncbi:metallophosphoesterase [Pseudomonas anguilliseptica]|uniref:metallophosphoesterase n=1 Tax=Pseudomonas anguilliseptica TaxID=53406 RepID=UPI0022AEC431|nr:metallophosphoesterase [Pseudomonas anguilliseptica]MCZ4323160.1 metallophosphoesterase [Pseudomonas anguilliseptica]